MRSDLNLALSARAAFIKTKRKLEDEGIDTSDIRYITDLPGVLGSLVTADLESQAEAILSDAETLNALLESFAAAADLGCLVGALVRPSDTVKDGDLFA